MFKHSTQYLSSTLV